MFKRKGADLYMTRRVTLYEALAGFHFQIKHLDGRPIVVSTPPGKIVGNNEVMTVEELGMPFFGRNYKYGNLFIHFEVVFPASLSKRQMKAVKEVLGAEKQEDRGAKEVYEPKVFEGSEKDLLAKLRKRSEDLEEEEGEQNGQHVECVTQ